MENFENPIKVELESAIRSAERQRIWFPLVFAGIGVLLNWQATGQIGIDLVAENLTKYTILLGFIYVGMEIINVKILLFKAELRELLR